MVFTDLYITQSSTNNLTVDDVCSARSLMKSRNNKGPRTEPWGTQDFTGDGSEDAPSTTTFCVLPSKTDVICYIQYFKLDVLTHILCSCVL